MNRNVLILATALFAAFLCLRLPAEAQDGHQNKMHSDKIGRVNFSVSCSAKAQEQFNHAVAWLHSFEYEDAEKVFTEVTVTDPQCAMGYWGVAMSQYHQIWAPPSATELQKGLSAVEEAKAAGARTERERDYIAAIEVFYKDSAKLDHRTRSLAYGDAMERLYLRYPSDREAAVFYALTLIDRGMMTSDKSYPNEKKAAQILNGVLAVEPEHPGVIHYLIHSYDYPALAHLALPAARVYAKIASASAHARHMPSHIFTRLGLWQEAILSNVDAQAAAKAYAVRNRMTGAWDEELHAMDYLAYAYLQGAQDKKARFVLDELYRIQKTEPENFKVAYSFTAIPARYALERRQWSEAVKLPLQPGILRKFPWQNFRWAEAHIRFARAVGAARIGDTTSARQEVEQLGVIRQALAEAKGGYDWAKQVEIQRQVAAAWLAYAEGKAEESLKLMRAAADLDDATEKHPVTPGAILPAREQLGELLLELNQSVAALTEFENSLRSTPNRFNATYGAARAARLASERKKAQDYYAKLLEISRLADDVRPEIKEAKDFLAGGTLSPHVNSSVQPTKILVRGVELHYIEQGQGEPLILLHGGQGDYRSWEPQIKAFSQQYRVISYSRRYNYPNDNLLTAKNHSAFVEAADLAAFIRKLKLGRVHLVGTSMGAFTALVLAVKHPEMVRSLVLAEPPVHRWMRDSPAGAPVYKEFMTNIHEPVAAAFKAGDDEGAMRIFVDGIAGTGRFDNLPTEGRAAVMQNSRFFKAITLSSDPFPNLSKDKVKRLSTPVLIVTGENTIKIHKLVNEELALLLPKAERATIPKAGHGSARENPQAFNEAVLKFLAKPRPN